MRRTAQYYNIFEGVRRPVLPAYVNATFQKAKATVHGALMWISKFLGWSRQLSAGHSALDTIELRENGSSSVSYVPICSCRRRTLDYAKIIDEAAGPQYDSDVFKELKEAYWRSRSRFARVILKLWIFDLREIRPVEVSP
jgi:hypothetical protein